MPWKSGSNMPFLVSPDIPWETVRGAKAALGLFSFSVGQILLEVTGSKRLATGFLRSAAESYARAQLVGPCEMLHQKWSSGCPPPPAPIILPSQVMNTYRESNGPPPLRRASASNSSGTIISLPSSGVSQQEARKANPDQLDAIALV